MRDPLWLSIARSYLGVVETPGAATTPIIRQWLIRLRAWWTDDDTPWCGAFVGEAMMEAAAPLPRAWYRAKAWLSWGVPLDEPVVGCVAVFDRDGGGHVGLVVGLNVDGGLLVLGGNQANCVSIAAFDPRRVLGFRWPPMRQLPPDRGPLPVIVRNAPSVLSQNEG